MMFFMKKTLKELGAYIKQRRHDDLKMTTAQLGKAIGISAVYITEIEMGRKFPPDKRIVKLAETLQSPYILGLYIEIKYPRAKELKKTYEKMVYNLLQNPPDPLSDKERKSLNDEISKNKKMIVGECPSQNFHNQFMMSALEVNERLNKSSFKK